MSGVDHVIDSKDQTEESGEPVRLPHFNQFIATNTNARLRFMETEGWLQQPEFTPRRLVHSKCCGQIVVHQSMLVD